MAAGASPGASAVPPAGASARAARIASIDALRGLVMLLMLVDHVRDMLYLHAQVRDPIDLAATPTGLVLTRMASHLCAPVFLLLTGLSARLYAERHGGRGAASRFLLTRGLVLIALELTLVNLAWTGRVLPPVLYLQVIWAIGLSMVALSGLLWLPRPALIAVALAIVLGHNALDPVVLAPDRPGYAAWSILHQRGMIPLPWGAARTSYPVLPWIGVIAAGYALSPLFAPGVSRPDRRAWLLGLAAAGLALFLLLRGLNGYGDPAPWRPGEGGGDAFLSFLNLTKYPASAGFLLLTLSLGLALLAVLEAVPPGRLGWLRTFGGVPLFFYLAHLWALRLVDGLGVRLGFGGASGRIELPAPGWIWGVAALSALALYPACAAVLRLKRRAAWPGWSYL